MLQKGTVVLLFAITGLLLALSAFAYFGGTSQAKLVNDERYQAVFLNNGQVYFGKVKSINDKYINLNNIFYLQTDNQTTSSGAAPSNVTLVKLGCELHGPFDQMVINADQVIFWENLQDSSEVVKKINEYKNTNKDGKCSDNTSTTQQATPSANTQQPSTNESQSSGNNTNNSTRRP